MKNKNILITFIAWCLLLSSCDPGALDIKEYNQNITGRITAIDSSGKFVSNFSGIKITTTIQMENKQVEIHATIEPDGIFRFNNLNKGEYKLTATREGFITTDKTVTAGTGELIEITLVHEKFKPKQPVILVASKNGFSLANADISLFASSFQRDQEDLAVAFFKGKTGTSGKLETSLTVSNDSVFALATFGFHPFIFKGKGAFMPGLKTFVIALDSFNHVLKTTLADQRGEPVANADVYLYSSAADMEADTLTNGTLSLRTGKSLADGTCTIALPEPGQYYIKAKKAYTANTSVASESGKTDCSRFHLTKLRMTLQ